MTTESEKESSGFPEFTFEEKQAQEQGPIALAKELVPYVVAALHGRHLAKMGKGVPGEDRPETVGEETARRRLWTPEETSEYLGVSIRTVNRLAREGDLSSEWVGGQRRFFPKAVENYVRSQPEDRA